MVSQKGNIWRECHCSSTDEGRISSERLHFYHILWEAKKKKGLTWMQWPHTASAASAAVAVREIIFLACILSVSERKRQGLLDYTMLLQFLLQCRMMISDVSPKEERWSKSGACWSCSHVAQKQSVMVPPPWDFWMWLCFQAMSVLVHYMLTLNLTDNTRKGLLHLT